MPNVSFGEDGAYILLVIGALFVHACYQLSVSVLTYMSSHRLSQKASVRQLLWLGTCYIIGVGTATTLVLTAIASVLSFLKSNEYAISAQTAVATVAIISPLIGLLTMILYYRHGSGTQLWLPRPIANYLLNRARKTRSGIESAMLGAATVVGELPFLIGPLLIAGVVVMNNPSPTWVSWSIIYSLLSCAPLAVVTLYLTSGHSIARVQRWREKNKNFLQWTSGIALILLTIYLVVVQFGATQ